MGMAQIERGSRVEAAVDSVVDVSDAEDVELDLESGSEAKPAFGERRGGRGTDTSG